MFRLQTYVLSLLILLGGGVAFWFDTHQSADCLEERLNLELSNARLGAEKNIDSWVADNVNQVIALASSPGVEKQLSSIVSADPQARRAAFDSAQQTLSLDIEKWSKNQTPERRPDWIWILDAEGRVVLRSSHPQERGDSVVGIPLVSTLLSGAALDSVWSLNDGVYAVAGAGSQADGHIVGGVVLGYKLDSAQVSSLGKNLAQSKQGQSAGLALVWGSKILGQNFLLEDGVIIPASPDPTVYGKAILPLAPMPVLIENAGRFIGESFSSKGWPSKLRVAVNVEHAKAFEGLAYRQLIVLTSILFLVLVIFLWGSSMRRAVMKPLSIIVDHLSEVQRGGAVGVLPETTLKEPYLRLGKLINMLIASGPASRSSSPNVASVGDILAASPAQSATPASEPGASSAGNANAPEDAQAAGASEFQFDGIPGLSSSSPAVPEVSPAEIGLQAVGDGPDLAAPAVASPAAASPATGESGIASLFDNVSSPQTPAPASPAASAAAPAAPAPPAAAAAPAPPAAPAPADPGSEDNAAADFLASFSSGPASTESAVALPGASPAALPGTSPASSSPAAPAPSGPPAGGWNPERTVMVQVPEELLEASASNAPPPPPPKPLSPPAEDYNPDATVVAAIPEDLLKQVIGGEPDKDPDDAHFHEVYDLFIATRKECGEPVADLTYERFLGKLKKNREQLISKYNCRTVRFQVYVKAGKAALKAVPVRD